MAAMDSYHEEERRKMVALKFKRIRNFFIHLVVYVFGVAIYILKTYYGFAFNFLPVRYITFFWMAIWTLVIVIDALSLLVTEIILGKKWEARQVRKRMETTSKKQIWK